MKTFPVPREDGILRERVVEISGRLAAVDNRYSMWAEKVGVDHGPIDQERKENLIHELDAVVAHLFGLSKSQLQVIYETFHEGWDFDQRLDNVKEHHENWSERLSDST